MAVRASREIVIDASSETVMDALADVYQLVAWSPVHKSIEVIDAYDDGRPHHVRATIKILGLVDREVLEYHWGPDWMVWDAEATTQQHGQHVEYRLTREAPERTRVRFDITVEPSGPIPAFFIRRASNLVLETATERLREQVLRGRRR